MNTKPRLIEVAFPLQQASLASVHEKNVRHGHISTLHIWPARRPLAASRAALIATLLSDPGNPEERQALLDRIGGKVVKKKITNEDDDGNEVSEEKDVVEGGLLAWGQEQSPDLEAIRQLILDANGGRAPRVIDPFSGGGAIPLEAMRLGCAVTAADINPVAWFVLKCTLEYPQRFAGQKWPLPAFVREWPDFLSDFRGGKIKKRKGAARTHFTDNRQLELKDQGEKAETLDGLPEADLAWQVRAWGRWVLERARQDLADRYPVENGEPTVAYLWARTARDKQTAGPIPLLKTFWLCKKAGCRAALLPLPADDNRSVRFALLTEADLKQPAAVIAAHPVLTRWEVTPENLVEFLNQGTMNRAGVWSPLSGRPGMIALAMTDLRRQGQQGLLGAQMTSVVVERQITPKKTRKAYRLPTEREIQVAKVEIEELEEAFEEVPFGLPDEPLPGPGTLGFRIPLYGFTKWRQVFTDRQLLALANFVRHIREAGKRIMEKDPERGHAVLAGLICAFDRMVDFNSSILSWIISVEAIGHTFARFALPMCWDYAEAAMPNGCRGGWLMCLDTVMEAMETALKAGGPGTLPPTVMREDAVNQGFANFDVVLTDPPYYDAIPYSDLMDYFYIWDRRLLYGLVPESKMFLEPLAPKWSEEKQQGELIQDDSRHGGDKGLARQTFENGMAKAFERCFNGLTPDGRLVVVFANKEVAAWETLVGGLIRGGAVVTASWPIQTEQAALMRAQTSAALASSVWIVCRKRAATAAPGWEENVLEGMRTSLFAPRAALGNRNILQYFFDQGIRGPDFLWAALGPALEAYSAHPFVKKTAGGLMTVAEFLGEVRRLVLHFALGELPGFKDISQQTQGRGEGLTLDPVTQYYLLHRAYFGLTPAPAGACIMYAQACGKGEGELRLVWNVIAQGGKSKRGRPTDAEVADPDDDEAAAGKGNEFTLVPWAERAAREDLGEARSGQPAPLIDRLHRLLRLFQQNRTAEVQQAYEGWGLANEAAFVPLLQAVRELAHQDGADTERRLVEALGTQLKLTRRAVTREGEEAFQADSFATTPAGEVVPVAPPDAGKPALTYRKAGAKAKKRGET